MLPALLMLLLSATVPPAAGENRFPEATEVFHCQFEAGSDKDFDTWPDGWTRQHGAGFPAYTKIHTQPEKSPGGENCLRFELDGGGAAAFTPPIPINTLYGYILEAYLRTEALKHDRAFLSLTFLDAEKHTLTVSSSEAITDSHGWKKIRLGAIEASSTDARWVVIGLHVEPQDEADLHGGACFSDIWLGRLPRLQMKTNQPHNFFILPDKPKITCTTSGLDERFSSVAFELFDVSGESLTKETRPLTPQTHAVEQNREAENIPSTATAFYTADWTPILPAPGFYRIRLALQGKTATADRREISLAVVEPRLPPPGGIFGWSLPQGARPLALPALTDLLGQVGIHWVKYPLWFSQEYGSRELEQILKFAEKLGEGRIELVGMLIDPPEAVREKIGTSETLTAAQVFSADPKLWYPSLEPAIIQMANKVHYWQLGRDTDAGLLILPNFLEKLTAIRATLDRAMQGMQLGIGWDWRQSLPQGFAATELPWNFVSLSSDPALSSRELGAYLDAAKQSPLKSWVVLSPLANDEYPLQTRAEDLVQRMIAAKIHGASAAFCPDPFDRKHGLLNPDGTPNELLMPWRTTALEIGGAQFLGEMVLPRGSRNWIFTRDNDAVMVVWNRQPIEEFVYLGKDVQQTDLWGRTSTSLELDGCQLVKVNPAPSFVTGIDKAIAQWSMGLQIKNKSLPNVFGQTLPNSFTVKNTFPKSITGKAVIIPPKDWIIEPREASLRLAPGEELMHNFAVNLPVNVGSGRNILRIDFEIQADRPYKFSVYRYLEVGNNDLRMEMHTRLNERQELEVEQRFINETEEPVSFRCELCAPDRRLLTTQILHQGRGEVTEVYRLEDGPKLLGKTLWLQAEEIDGLRILNYRFQAEE